MTSLRTNSSSLFDDDPTEEHPKCLTDCAHTGLTAESKQVTGSHELNGVALDERRVVPHVVEGEAGEFTSPAERQREAAERCHQLVATAQGAVEAHAGVPPHTVY